MCESLLNFRPVGGNLYFKKELLPHFNRLQLNAYRSARPDNINREELKQLHSKLGIRYFLDLRYYKHEYQKESGKKLLDHASDMSSLKIVDIDRIVKQKLRHIVWCDNEEHDQRSPQVNSKVLIHHYMVNLIGRDFVHNMLQDIRLPLWKRLFGIFLLLLYLLFGMKYFADFVRKEIEQNGLLRLYKSIVDYSGTAVRVALQVIVQQGAVPFIICCHAGKDRTGILSAILLSVCGYDRDAICDDYAMSEIGIPFSHEEMRKFDERIRHAPRDVMYKLLVYVDKKYGSMSEYLVHNGFSLEDQEILKAQLFQKG